MLGNANVTATIAVKDLPVSRQFYEQVLGLTEVVHETEYVMVYKSGSTQLQVYVSGTAGTNQATSATWAVDDIQAAVSELKAKGVTFEHYEMPGVTMEGDVHIMAGEHAAWFKDPDGNILCMHQDV